MQLIRILKRVLETIDLLSTPFGELNRISSGLTSTKLFEDVLSYPFIAGILVNIEENLLNRMDASLADL